ncbi:hypothetical protein PAERUG_P45_London_17_VIM_2_12_12_04692 [Pseudomonas aeruginosa]|nr:hypothetical protein PAERUG_P45_London_17_VIM_2_12_12_04692 [Pseudomonas aeruginosa]
MLLAAYLPIAAQLRLGIGTPGQQVAGQQFLDLAERRLRSAPGQRQEVDQADRVEPGGEFRMRQDGLDLRAEQQSLAVPRVIQRLDAQAVAHQQQVAVAAIEDGEGEHPGQVLATTLAPLQIGVQDHLGIAAGAELMSGPAQPLAQGIVVVHLAGVDEGDLLAGGKAIGHRLHAAAEVDDRQPPVTQQGVAVLPDALGIRPAQGERIGHGEDRRKFVVELARVIHPTRETAHRETPLIDVYRETHPENMLKTSVRPDRFPAYECFAQGGRCMNFSRT